jgi:hypothetical protein
MHQPILINAKIKQGAQIHIAADPGKTIVIQYLQSRLPPEKDFENLNRACLI